MPRRILFTINNPTYQDQTMLEMVTKHEQFRYLIYQGEMGEQGTPHFQGYLEILKNQRQSFFKNLIGERAHIEFCRGSALDNIHYCSKPLINKDGSQCQCESCVAHNGKRLSGPFEYGQPSTEITGAHYWESVIEMVKMEKTDIEIIEQYPQTVSHLKNVKEFRQTYRMSLNVNPEITDPQHQLRRLRVVWLYGPSGAGKTFAVFQIFPNVYKVSKKNGFDYYAHERVIMFDDFSAEQFKFETMLDYLDVYPVQLNCRYNNIWAAYNDVFILSTKKPNEIYSDVNMVDFQQFMRRICLIEVYFDQNQKPEKRMFRYQDFHHENLIECLNHIQYRC